MMVADHPGFITAVIENEHGHRVNNLVSEVSDV